MEKGPAGIPLAEPNTCMMSIFFCLWTPNSQTLLWDTMYPEEGHWCQLPAWQEMPWDGFRVTEQAPLSPQPPLSLSLSQNQPQKIFVGKTKASVPTQVTQCSCQKPSDLHSWSLRGWATCRHLPSHPRLRSSSMLSAPMKTPALSLSPEK